MKTLTLRLHSGTITKYLLVTTAFIFSLTTSFAQGSALWQRCLGGSQYEQGVSVVQATDGGFVVAGGSGSTDGNVTGNHGEDDFWIVKLSASGSIVWQKAYGGMFRDVANVIRNTTDGGYIVAGYCSYGGGNITGHHGNTDMWVIKLSASGALLWQKAIGGYESEEAYDIQQTADGGYIVVGHSNSVDGDATANFGSHDVWVVKLTATGTIQWQKNYGGSQYESGYSIIQNPDGTYIVAGSASSTDGQVVGMHGDIDAWVLKISATGSLVWRKSFGGDFEDGAFSVIPANDGGYIVCGHTITDNNGDVSGNHGSSDIWVLKLSAAGALQWQKCLGGLEQEYGRCAIKSYGDGFVIAGSASSTNADVTGFTHGDADLWIVKMSYSGTIQWKKVYGGSGSDIGSSIAQTTDGGFIVGGTTNSTNGDVTDAKGDVDYWVIRLAPDPLDVQGVNPAPVVSFAPNPATGLVSITGVDKANVQLYNVIGQKVMDALNTGSFSVASLPAGVYLVRLSDEQGKLTGQGKLVKE